MELKDLDIHWHEEIFHLIQHEIHIRHKGIEYIVRTTTSGNDFEVKFKDGDDWRDANTVDKVEQYILKILDDGDYLVGDWISRY